MMSGNHVISEPDDECVMEDEPKRKINPVIPVISGGSLDHIP